MNDVAYFCLPRRRSPDRLYFQSDPLIQGNHVQLKLVALSLICTLGTGECQMLFGDFQNSCCSKGPFINRVSFWGIGEGQNWGDLKLSYGEYLHFRTWRKRGQKWHKIGHLVYDLILQSTTLQTLSQGSQKLQEFRLKCFK